MPSFCQLPTQGKEPAIAYLDHWEMMYPLEMKSRIKHKGCVTPAKHFNSAIYLRRSSVDGPSPILLKSCLENDAEKPSIAKSSLSTTQETATSSILVL
eukprot:14065412-Ditylum_brightwellii.AAC.1